VTESANVANRESSKTHFSML